jgi:hypothetical protein
MRNRMVAGAVTLSLPVTGGLTARIVAINKPAVIVILIPALAGAFIAIRRHGRIALGISALLTALTAMISLIGGEGSSTARRSCCSSGEQPPRNARPNGWAAPASNPH